MNRAAVSACAAASMSLWCGATSADILAPEPHAYGCNRLYVGGLSFSVPSSGFFDIFVDAQFDTGVRPHDPPAPGGGGNTDADDWLVWRKTSFNGLPPGEPVIYGIPPFTFFDVFADFDPGTGGSGYSVELFNSVIGGIALPGGGFAEIRESPTLASVGRYTVQPLAGGYRIDSFFDIFTEISLDGGQSWTTAAGPSRFTLVPAPGAAAILGLAGLVTARRRR